MYQVKGRWALITGAARGIGRLTALFLAEQGCHLILHSRDLRHTAPLLQEVRERARPGTAGASLTAMELGAKLLDWSSAAEADEAQVRAAVEAFLAPLGEPERAEFALQMSGVSGAVTRLQTEDAAAMMEDIGGTEGTLFPWPDARTELLEALFDAAGANGEIIDPNE